MYKPNIKEVTEIVSPNLTKSFRGLFENDIIELKAKLINLKKL
ncbi:hypothetical protein FEM08_36200 [Flavobacterium gilvum]|nr:hypothetical protein FEM08_36200 [Flavobacterium gilvum]